MRAALTWARGLCTADLGLRLALSLTRFWTLRGYLSEGRSWLEDLLEAAPANDEGHARMRALAGAAVLTFRQGDYAQTIAYSEQHLEMARALGNRAEMAAALDRLASAVANEGDSGRAMSL